MNNRGMSAIVTTVILTALVLVAIGIVWAVISNIIEGGAEDIGISGKCLDVNLAITTATCIDSTCDVSVERKSGEEVFDGLTFIFSDGTDSGTPVNEEGNIEVLASNTITGLEHGLTSPATPTSVDVIVYFLDESGTEQLCSTKETFNIA